LKRRLSPDEQALVERHIPMAERIARSLVRHYRAYHYEDVARSTALEALTEARGTFDPAEGVPFDCFAWRRINGKVTDALHKEARHWEAWHSGAIETAELVEDPSNVLADTDEETSAHVDRLANEVMAGALLRFASEVKRTPGEAGEALRATYAAALRVVQEAVSRLSAEDQVLIDLHEWQALPWDSVASRLGVPVRTAKRRHQQIRRRVAVALHTRRSLVAPDQRMHVG
jgi:RNA polymerase sigma factor FliA